MTQKEQKEYVLDYVQDWAGSTQAALMSYESEVITALNKTAQQPVDFESGKIYL
ncbi:MAG: hypothetical protein ACJA0H_001237 [Francisellaceae bacterium]|jgi:hypothetical protein